MYNWNYTNMELVASCFDGVFFQKCTASNWQINMFGFAPSPFKVAKWEQSGAKDKAPQKNPHPKCFRWDHEVRAKDASRNWRPVKCDCYSAIFHLGCASLIHPPRFGSWACDGCKKAL